MARVRPSSLPSISRAELWELRSSALQQSGLFSDALSACLNARRAYETIHDDAGVASMALRAGDLSRQIESFERAAGFYRSALAWSRRYKRHPSAARTERDARVGLAMCFRGEGKFAKALALFGKARRAYATAGDASGLAFVLWAIGTTSRFAGRLSAAQICLKDCIRRYRSLGDASGLAYSQAALGGTYRMMGLAAESGALYHQASRTFTRLRDDFGRAYSFCGQSNALRMRRKLAAALPFMKRAESLYRRLRQSGPLGFVLWSRAQWHLTRGEFRQAARLLSQAARLFDRVGDRRGALYVELGRAALAQRMNHPSADAALRAVGEKARRLDLPLERAHALRLLGDPSWRTAYRATGALVGKVERYNTLP